MELDTIIHSIPRLHIMQILSNGEAISFQSILEKLKLTSGNLFSHCSVLENAGYILKFKNLDSPKTQVMFKITALGMEQFSDYLKKMEIFLIKTQDKMEWTPGELESGLPPSIFVQVTDGEGYSFNLAKFD